MFVNYCACLAWSVCVALFQTSIIITQANWKPFSPPSFSLSLSSPSLQYRREKKFYDRVERKFQIAKLICSTSGACYQSKQQDDEELMVQLDWEQGIHGSNIKHTTEDEVTRKRGHKDLRYFGLSFLFAQLALFKVSCPCVRTKAIRRQAACCTVPFHGRHGNRPAGTCPERSSLDYFSVHYLQ